MGRQAAVVLYVLALVAVVVGVDVLFFRNRFWERLIVNVGIPISGRTPHRVALVRSQLVFINMTIIGHSSDIMRSCSSTAAARDCIR
jgi:hypothetical protein